MKNLSFLKKEVFRIDYFFPLHGNLQYFQIKVNALFAFRFVYFVIYLVANQ